jgi:hypothetical protein
LERELRDIVAGLPCKRSEGKGPEATLAGCAKVVINLGVVVVVGDAEGEGSWLGRDRVKGGALFLLSLSLGAQRVPAPAN